MIKKIINYWEGGNPIISTKHHIDKNNPPLDNWTNIYKDFEYEMFNRDSAGEFLKNIYGTEIYNLFNSFDDRFPAARSDFFRVGYCLSQGGIYIDRRFVAQNNVRMVKYLKQFPELLLISKPGPKITNGFIHCKPNNMILNAVWCEILYNVKYRQFKNNVWRCTGPGAYKPVVDRLNINIQDITITNDTFHTFVKPIIDRDRNHWSELQKTVSIFS